MRNLDLEFEPDCAARDRVEVATEHGAELFYRIGMAEWLDLTLAAQLFNAGQSDEKVTNVGVRLRITL